MKGGQVWKEGEKYSGERNGAFFLEVLRLNQLGRHRRRTLGTGGGKAL